MYQPPHFIENNTATLHAFVKAHPFATLVTTGLEGLFVTHLPLVFKTSQNAFFGHIARANPHFKKADPAQQAVLIFNGPNTYVSPNFYPSKAETHKVVPTYNYAVVHAYGLVDFPDDVDFLKQNLTDLTTQFESGMEHPWALSDAPDEFIKAQLKGIIGVKFDVHRFDGKFKLSQNRNSADTQGVIDGLKQRGGPQDHAIAAMMRIKP